MGEGLHKQYHVQTMKYDSQPKIHQLSSHKGCGRNSNACGLVMRSQHEKFPLCQCPEKTGFGGRKKIAGWQKLGGGKSEQAECRVRGSYRVKHLCEAQPLSGQCIGCTMQRYAENPNIQDALWEVTGAQHRSSRCSTQRMKKPRRTEGAVESLPVPLHLATHLECLKRILFQKRSSSKIIPEQSCQHKIQ